MKIELYPEKAQYLTLEPIRLILEVCDDVNDELNNEINKEINKEVNNETNKEVKLKMFDSWKNDAVAVLEIYYLEKMISTKTFSIKYGKNYLKLEGFEDFFAGYGAEVKITRGPSEVFEASTSFDVVKSPNLSLRYGFLSDFTTEDGMSDSDLDKLRKFHINLIQFYDWSYRHDQLVSPTDCYQDMMGKNIDLGTVRSKILKCKYYGMKPMAYGAVYAASKDFYQAHSDWAFYNGMGEVYQFINTFYIMNIMKESPWHQHIIGQYREAVEQVGFSGIHMDTYGFPKTAYSHYAGEHKRIRLDYEFEELINDTKEELNKVEKDNYLVFNNVGNWPVASVAHAKQAAIYIEVWNPYERYSHIKQLIQEAKSACNHSKPVILAAYLAPFRLEDGRKAEYAAYLLTAAIVTNGGYHLLLGEENAVLTQGYYSDYSFLPTEQAGKLRKYYDFMIRYMNLFYEPNMRDVSMTHMGWDNYEYQCDFEQWSTYGEADKIWITLRENDQYKCISLINLCGCKEDYWNKGKDKPEKQRQLSFCVHVDKEIQGIYAASPDFDSEKSYPIEYGYDTSDKGRFIRFTLEELEVWTLIYIIT